HEQRQRRHQQAVAQREDCCRYVDGQQERRDPRAEAVLRHTLVGTRVSTPFLGGGGSLCRRARPRPCTFSAWRYRSTRASVAASHDQRSASSLPLAASRALNAGSSSSLTMARLVAAASPAGTRRPVRS